MRQKTLFSLVATREIPDGILKFTLTLMKEIYSPLMMLVIFGGMFVTSAIAQTSRQTKILATAAQPTTDAATQRRINRLKRIDVLIKRLGDEKKNVHKSTVNALGKMGKLAVQPLINALGDENLLVRANAASAIGLIGSQRAVQPLRKVLKDKEQSVRNAAKEALTISQIAVTVVCLSYLPRGWPLRLAPTSGIRMITLSPKVPRNVKNIPVLKHNRLWGQLQLGSPYAVNRILFIIDDGRPDEVIMHLDADQDRKFTNNGEALKNQGSGAFARVLNLQIRHQGSETTTPYILWFFINDRGWRTNRADSYSRCHWKGILSVDGATYDIVLFDNPADGD